jgi:uracil-DNA glycosylase
MINKKWDLVLKEEFNKEYFKKLGIFIKNEYKTKTIFPPYENIFDALRFTDYDKVKVVILGQDPYHQPFQAHGLCFSVNKGIKIPPSLVNIYKEINMDLGCKIPSHGNLTKWATQGVLLLNTIMSVRDSSPMSHSKKGWESFTDRVIKELNDDNNPKVFLLWGAPSRKKKELITNSNHLILECAHPSPLSAYNGFFGCKHFSKTNDFLSKHGRKIIDWQIDE